MTADQVQAVKDLSLSPADTQALMKQFNIQMPQMPSGFQGTPRAPSQQNGGAIYYGGNTQGGAQAVGPGGFPGGDGGGPGGFPPDGGVPGGGFPGGQQQNAQGTPIARGTPGAGRAGGFRGGINNLFVDPLIKVLAERAGVPLATATPAP